MPRELAKELIFIARFVAYGLIAAMVTACYLWWGIWAGIGAFVILFLAKAMVNAD